MEEKIVRIILVGLIFLIGFVCLGVHFQTHHWFRWILFTVGYIIILKPAIDYWNETLKDKK